jgi:hypothetical protein
MGGPEKSIKLWREIVGNLDCELVTGCVGYLVSVRMMDMDVGRW